MPQPLACALQISKTLTHYAAIALFIFFGLRSLHDAFAASESVSPPHFPHSGLPEGCSQQGQHAAPHQNLCVTHRRTCLAPCGILTRPKDSPAGTHTGAYAWHHIACLPGQKTALLLQEEGGSELEEVERELAGQKGQAGNLGSAKGKEKMGAPPRSILSPIFLQAFTLTFLAEWGDRSQVLHPMLSAGLLAVFGPFSCGEPQLHCWPVCLHSPPLACVHMLCHTVGVQLMWTWVQIATIGLAASVDVIGVTLGGIVGHALCTGAAVLGGRKMATLINERVVGIAGGVLFILFGLHAFWSGVED